MFVVTMLKIKRLRQCFRLIGFLVFTTLPLNCIGSEFNDNQIASAMKAIDMEYGEQLTSLEQGESLVRSGRYTRQNGYEKPKMRCTTERPLPEMDPSYIPPSSCEEKNQQETTPFIPEFQTQRTTLGYLAPHPVGDKLFEIDDY